MIIITENCTVPSDVALYVHMKLFEFPPFIVAFAGAGPVSRAAPPVPDKIKLVGVTFFALAVPTLLKVILTVIVSEAFTALGDSESVPVRDAAATVVTLHFSVSLPYPDASAETFILALTAGDDGAKATVSLDRHLDQPDIPRVEPDIALSLSWRGKVRQAEGTDERR